MPEQTTLPSVPTSGLARIEDAANFLQVCRTTIYAMIRDGELPSVQVRNARRVPWSALHQIASAGADQ
ncbi:MAG: helix-turn-helix domain-containing protein [Planctomycetaceae bacterium]|nr:helix-turn-helix domain-containing protein [Planctomycetaceae bacterium]